MGGGEERAASSASRTAFPNRVFTARSFWSTVYRPAMKYRTMNQAKNPAMIPGTIMGVGCVLSLTEDQGGAREKDPRTKLQVPEKHQTSVFKAHHDPRQ